MVDKKLAKYSRNILQVSKKSITFAPVKMKQLVP